mmetsp:Transcript_46790/g.124226  ORF Transcript_46790/g.124226 Transcript_46790/m.124226 type:complete len:237 (-) Transcript_46790:202-912(-)
MLSHNLLRHVLALHPTRLPEFSHTASLFRGIARNNDSLQNARHNAHPVEAAVGQQKCLSICEVDHSPVKHATNNVARTVQIHCILFGIGLHLILVHHESVHRLLQPIHVVPHPRLRVWRETHPVTMPFLSEGVARKRARSHCRFEFHLSCVIGPPRIISWDGASNPCPCLVSGVTADGHPRVLVHVIWYVVLEETDSPEPNRELSLLRILDTPRPPTQGNLELANALKLVLRPRHV